MGESFSQSRMDRCIRIQQEILSNWQKTTVLDCTIRATESIAGLSLSDMRRQYFSIGVGSELTDLPFTDVLVVYSMIVQAVAALKAKVASNEKAGRIQFRITTDFSDSDAAAMLSQMKIETPFDDAPFLTFNPLD